MIRHFLLAVVCLLAASAVPALGQTPRVVLAEEFTHIW